MTIIDGFTVFQRGGLFYATMKRGREIHRLWPAKTLREVERAIYQWWVTLPIEGW
jgi:hypothetical protein